jgi:demethylmenaquinone methyltransferase/2-methoxy-6-polyprenyl-1,4-benzoquinol methylase
MTMTRADLGKDPDEVSRMFDRVAKRYDLLNDLLSLGQTKRWRKSVNRIVAARPGMRILDIAAGTGTSSAALAKSGAEVIAVDFSKGMIETGKRLHPELSFVFGDALALPFDDGEFDATTISFGLRNTQDTRKALIEALRVTKPGGAIYVVEFSHPTSRIFRTIYLRYLLRAMPPIARRLSSNPDAYIYLAESIIAWPDQRELAALMTGAGWEGVRWKNLTFGVVAVHIGERPVTISTR